METREMSSSGEVPNEREVDPDRQCRKKAACSVREAPEGAGLSHETVTPGSEPLPARSIALPAQLKRLLPALE